jgi:hypothetical protein
MYVYMSRLSPVLHRFCKRELQTLFSQYRRHFPGVNPPGCKAAHKFNAEVKNEWSYKSKPPCAAIKYIRTIYLYVYGIHNIL